ncbi:DUF551 domain-containing protein [Anaerosporobacter sp.]|uniref:DUF551 domain-containing protein n=1 Tax=Anaerosporobacter sp. TaxID=1872529 RepID=UPI00286ECE2A|nr:DUF551 domain-containing protein [Anaerosporobacter sp.]
MRLIDTDKFEKYLLEKFGPSQDSTVLFLYGLIAEQPTVEQDNWISCSERLPSNKQQVIVCDNIATWVCNFEEEHGFCTPYFGGTFNYRIYEHVIAWQPLPEPYKGVGSK